MCRLPILFFISIFFLNCSTKKITDIDYLQDNSKLKDVPKLNIFVSKSPKTENLPVIFFVHGGNWNSGNKGTYGALGRNFAQTGFVTVIPDYTLSPDANYDQMTMEVAEALRWTQKNISKYGGDPSQIYVSGHSAGGHLVALAVMNPKYNIDEKEIAGIILNDAAGLDMKNYLQKHPPTNAQDYLATWTNDPKQWHDASPIYYINQNTPPIMMYVGTKTYKSIKDANENFFNVLQAFQPNVEPIFVDKSHIAMALQYFSSGSPRFGEIKDFVDQQKSGVK